MTETHDVRPPVRHGTPFSDGRLNGNPADLSFAALIAEDWRTHFGKPFSQGFWAIFWHRFGNWRMDLPFLLRAPCTIIYRVMSKLTEWVSGIHLPYPVRVGRRVRLDHFGGMILVPRAIGDDVVLRHNTTMGLARVDAPDDKPILGNRVDVGTGAVLVGAITIGDDAVIGANAVVVHDVPSGAIVGGIPARILKQRETLPQSAPLASAAE